ncbi:MAG: hypothetical protein KAV87_26815, partial [Desulfobacteraceae bacterium]|nr:hypothetical protein [Desulfobacteraceae bacterium]
MNKKRNEKWLDKLISRTINTTKPEFDVEKWKQKYPDEFQSLLSRAAKGASVRQSNVLKLIFKSPFAKLAAAAVIILCAVLYLSVTFQKSAQDQPTIAVTKTVRPKAASSKVTAMLVAYPPGPGEVCLDRNLDGEKLNRPITKDGWIQIGKDLNWRYTDGKYLNFTQEEAFIYVSADDGPVRMAGVRLRTADDLEYLHTALLESERPLMLWCDIQPPIEISSLPTLEKISAFQQVNPKELTDLAPLAYLTNLGWIYIYNRHQPCLGIDDISALVTLSELRVLTLREFHNLSEICELGANLTYLDLTGAINLKNLTPLAKLTKLEYLKLHSCYRVTDISPLEDLTSLTSLELFGCQTKDLSPLSNLTNLTFLGLCGSKVSDIQPLASLRNLEKLNLGACKNLSDLSPLSNLVNLKDLDLWACREVTDIWPLATLQSLEILNLRACVNISDLTPLAGLTNLKKLDCLGCEQISNLWPLANLTSLENVNLTVCPAIVDIWPLKPLIAQGTNVYVSDPLKEQLSAINTQILTERISESSLIVRAKLLEATDTELGQELIRTDWKVEIIKTIYGEVPGRIINVVIHEPDTRISDTS